MCTKFFLPLLFNTSSLLIRGTLLTAFAVQSLVHCEGGAISWPAPLGLHSIEKPEEESAIFEIFAYQSEGNSLSI